MGILPSVTRLKALIATVLLALALAPVPVALATAEPESTTVVTVAEPMDPSLQPAVVVEDAAAADEDLAWTFRYLVPTVLAIAALGVVLTLFGYAIRVRGRYRVVR